MNRIVKHIIEMKGISPEHARLLVKETADEIMCNPDDALYIIKDYLCISDPDETTLHAVMLCR